MVPGADINAFGCNAEHSHAFSFPGCFTSTGMTAQNLLVQGESEKGLELEPANSSVRIGLLPDLAQSVMNLGRCSAGLLNKVEQFN